MMLLGSIGAAACSHEKRPAPATAASTVADAGSAPKTEAEPPAPRPAEPPEPVRTALGLRGSELFIPSWFTTHGGRYDLVVHFHGEGRWQEQNVERAKLNVAVVSVNLGMGTPPYSNAFKDPEVFERLLADVEAEVTKSRGEAKLGRLALSAWSAGFSSISRIMSDTTADRVDAVLLADGFFTNFKNVRKRTINTAGLERWTRFSQAARKNEKLFAITHTTIPTGPYPSVQECVGKLLELESIRRKPCSIDGPRPKMHQFYKVDEGSFHIAGFHGKLAADHVRQLHAMGETTYPYLKERWEKQDAEETAAR
ncbi:MAG: hypothetical protein KIT84_33000 [Labilithrix sp.]|nr:hypothetical protein [Labilithrix sp.]MCW5815894.1 hypothetical protein [Labilithrix sp.]